MERIPFIAFRQRNMHIQISLIRLTLNSERWIFIVRHFTRSFDKRKRVSRIKSRNYVLTIADRKTRHPLTHRWKFSTHVAKILSTLARYPRVSWPMCIGFFVFPVGRELPQNSGRNQDVWNLISTPPLRWESIGFACDSWKPLFAALSLLPLYRESKIDARRRNCKFSWRSRGTLSDGFQRTTAKSIRGILISNFCGRVDRNAPVLIATKK